MRIFENEFEIEHREVLRDYFDSYEYMCSGASFSSLYMWRNINDFTWEIIGDYLCIEGLSHLELESNEEVHFMMPPMTATGDYDPDKLRESIKLAREKFEGSGVKFTIRLVPGHMLDMIKKACPDMTFEVDRPNYDYIYETKRLIDYSGRKLHRKKNHFNYFKRTYQYECLPIRPDMTDNIMEFVSWFNRNKDIPPEEMKFLLMEEEAMRDVFTNIDAIGCIGCTILIEGKIQAIALGGWLGENTIVEHIEKANSNYRGLYQVVLSEFCNMASSRATYINREEDMDLDNLREMKLSYRPVQVLDKYLGTINT